MLFLLGPQLQATTISPSHILSSLSYHPASSILICLNPASVPRNGVVRKDQKGLDEGNALEVTIVETGSDWARNSGSHRSECGR